MFSVLVSSFVVAACLIAITLSVFVLRHEKRNRAWLDQQIQEDIEAGVFPDWLYEHRMDVPKKYPALRTRSTKALR